MNKANVIHSSIALFVFLALLLISNAIAIVFQKEQQSLFANELLTQAETISTQVLHSLNDAQAFNLTTCNVESINKLRKIVSRYDYVYDVGLIDENGNVACSANWGRLIDPKPLPTDAYITPFGLTLMDKVSNILPADFKLDAVKLDNYVSFTRLTLFKEITAKHLNFSLNVKMKNNNLTFFNYETKDQTALNLSFLNIRTSTCSQIYAYCVNTFRPTSGLLVYQSSVWIVILLLSAFISLLVAYAYKSYRSAYNSMEFRLKKAISENQLSMEYQPVVSAATGEIIKFESLVRWTDEVHGKVSPELFLTLANKLSLYPKVANQIVRMSLKEMAPILQNKPTLGLALNVTSHEVLSQGYLDFLYNLTLKYKIRPSQIKIEITEKINVELAKLTTFSKQAKNLGFIVVLDDFGTGVANLVWLTEINFDVIKVDRVFTQALTNDLKSTMVLSILNLINDLNKEVVFEGVETKEELDLILSITPSALVQGWYFYRSLPIKDIVKLRTLS